MYDARLAKIEEAIRKLFGKFPKNSEADAQEGHVHGPAAKASAYNSAAISHTTSGTFQVITLDSEYYDSHGMHSTSSNTSRLTCVLPGTYIAIGSFNWAAAAGGRRMGEIRLNGSTSSYGRHEIGSVADATALPTHICITPPLELITGDYLELFGFQSSGGALNIQANANFSPVFSMFRVPAVGGGGSTGGGGTDHVELTLAADLASILGISASQELSLDTQAANVIFAGPTTGADADPTFRAMVAADLPASVVETTDANYVDLTDGGGTNLHVHAIPGHDLLSVAHEDTSSLAVTLGALVYGAVGPIWGRLTGNVTTTKKFLAQTGDGAASAAPAWDTIADGDVPATHSGSSHHTIASLGASADNILGLGASQVLTVDSQAANLVLAGPTSGGSTTPTFRSLVSADLPATVVETGDADYTDLTDGGATTLHSHSGGSGHTIREDGTGLTARTGLNFVDTDVAAAVDDLAGDETEIRLNLYAALAGRSGGQTLIGGTADGNALTLKGNSADTTDPVVLASPLKIAASPNNIIVDSGGTTRLTISTIATFTSTIAVAPAASTGNLVNVVIDDVGGITGNRIFYRANVGSTNNGCLIEANNRTVTIFDGGPTATLDPVTARTGVKMLGMSFTPSVGGGIAGTVVDELLAFRGKPGLSLFTGTVTALYGLDLPAPAITGGTPVITTARGINIGNYGASQIATSVAIDIAAQSGSTTVNMGIRNAASTIFTPSTVQTLVAGTAILANATLVMINSTGNVTLTSTPTIADGQDGQILVVLNVDTADTITLQDQGTLASSNLRLVGTGVALAPRESVMLVYSSTVGDWVQVSASGNVT